MNDSDFLQSSITINKGESVTLIDDDPVTPHIISNGTWENETAKAAIEPGAPKVQNVQINANSSGSIGPFTTTGTFKFYCTIHTDMNLAVIVK
jgi:plastocyanin